MLKFSAEQMDQMERRYCDRITGRIRPVLREEFGDTVVSRVEPMAQVVATAVAIKLDRQVEIYRFARVLCALEAEHAIPQRRMLVARVAQQPVPQEDRLDRLERAAFQGDDRENWTVFWSDAQFRSDAQARPG